MHEPPLDLPEPIDDGAARHLSGRRVPDIALPTSAGDEVILRRLPGRTIVYAYPMSGDDDSVLPANWDAIPGARGCTPEHCNIRDHHATFNRLALDVYGLATQEPTYLAEEVKRLDLPYPLISDRALTLTSALNLPVLPVKVDGLPVLRRLTLVIDDGVIVKVFYPVFPPNKAAEQVIRWTRATAAQELGQP